MPTPRGLCDRHDPEAHAFTFVSADLSGRVVTYGELADRSRRMATVLRSLGVERGHRVAVLMGKRLELVVSLLAIWRLGAVHVPLFTAFAPGAIEIRLRSSRVRLVISEPSQSAKLNDMDGVSMLEADAELDARIDASSPLDEQVPVGGRGQLIELYTSGTTGSPKAVPLPGFAPAVVDGQIAMDTSNSPLMWFEGYVDAPGRTAERFTPDGRWYLTGDTGRADADGFFYFTARDDDVILAAGYRIGPFDVESALIAHPAVAEVAVVGAPDELRGEVVVTHVVLADGARPGPEFETELQDLVRSRYSAHAYPRRVHIVDSLPKTPSGKIQRFLLRRVEPSGEGA